MANNKVKVVFSGCFGGFQLSNAGLLRAREISGNPTWGDNDGWLRDVERHDPVLVRVVEELGSDASGDYASLAIAEIPAGSRYRIDEYDGNESVMTVDDYDWKFAE
jgi:hypothetical protein